MTPVLATASLVVDSAAEVESLDRDRWTMPCPGTFQVRGSGIGDSCGWPETLSFRLAQAHQWTLDGAVTA